MKEEAEEFPWESVLTDCIIKPMTFIRILISSFIILHIIFSSKSKGSY